MDHCRSGGGFRRDCPCRRVAAMAIASARQWPSLPTFPRIADRATNARPPDGLFALGSAAGPAATRVYGLPRGLCARKRSNLTYPMGWGD
jgi:hypothetical protein